MKTILEYLKTLPDPYRKQAIDSAKSDPDGFIDDEVESAEDAIGCAFNWAKSPQGYDYWAEVIEHCRNPQHPLPTPWGSPNPKRNPKPKRKRGPRKPTQLDRIEGFVNKASADAGLTHAAVIALQEKVARIESSLATPSAFEKLKEAIEFGTWVEYQGAKYRIASESNDCADRWLLTRSQYGVILTRRAKRSEFKVIDPHP